MATAVSDGSTAAVKSEFRAREKATKSFLKSKLGDNYYRHQHEPQSLESFELRAISNHELNGRKVRRGQVVIFDLQGELLGIKAARSSR